MCRVGSEFGWELAIPQRVGLTRPHCTVKTDRCLIDGVNCLGQTVNPKMVKLKIRRYRIHCEGFSETHLRRIGVNLLAFFRNPSLNIKINGTRIPRSQATQWNYRHLAYYDTPNRLKKKTHSVSGLPVAPQ